MKKIIFASAVFCAMLVFSLLLTGCANEDEEIVKIIQANDTIFENTTPEVTGNETETEFSYENDTVSDDSNATSGISANHSVNETAPDETNSSENGNGRVRNLSIEFVDIGGNSVLIRTPHRKAILIDGGKNNDGLKLVKYILNKGITKIDFLTISNAEPENAGGLPSVIFNFNESQAYYAGVDYNGNYIAYKSYQNYANAYSYPPIAITESKSFEVEDGIGFQAFVPFGNESNGEPKDDTVVYRLDYNDASVLFLGDCRGLCFEKIMENDIKADVLGVHGYVSEDIIKAVSPQIIVYDKVPNGTAQPEGIRTYSREEGAVMILTDGDKFYISVLGKA